MLTLPEIVRQRRSVRGFEATPVPRRLIEEALAVAQWSPSNCNAQPWRVTVAAGERCERLRSRLLEAATSGVPIEENPTPKFTGSYRMRQVACAVELYGCMGIERNDRPGRRAAELRNFAFFDAPCVAIISMDRDFGVGVALDVGAYLQTFLLALTARGIQSCAQASLRCYASLIQEELELDPRLQVLCGVSIGYEAKDVAANRAQPGRVPFTECCTLLGFDDE